jgi:hypothetical protein
MGLIKSVRSCCRIQAYFQSVSVGYYQNMQFKNDILCRFSQEENVCRGICNLELLSSLSLGLQWRWTREQLLFYTVVWGFEFILMCSLHVPCVWPTISTSVLYLSIKQFYFRPSLLCFYFRAACIEADSVGSWLSLIPSCETCTLPWKGLFLPCSLFCPTVSSYYI